MICPNCGVETELVIGGVCRLCPADFIGVRVVHMRDGGTTHVIACDHPAEAVVAFYRLAELIEQTPEVPPSIRAAAVGVVEAVGMKSRTPMLLRTTNAGPWKGAQAAPTAKRGRARGHRTKAAACPACGHEMDGATAIGPGNPKPKEGDLSLCISCGAVLTFDAEIEPVLTVEGDLERMTEEQKKLIALARAAIRARGPIVRGRHRG